MLDWVTSVVHVSSELIMDLLTVLHDHGGYIFAFLGGAVIAVIEVFRVYPDDVGDVLQSVWGWLLIALSAVSAAIVYGIYWVVYGTTPQGWLRELVVGLSSPVLLRSNLVVIRGSKIVGDQREQASKDG